MKDTSASKPTAEAKAEVRQPGRGPVPGQPLVSMIALGADAAALIPGAAWMPGAQRVAGNQFVERQVAGKQGITPLSGGRSASVGRALGVESRSAPNAIQRYAVRARADASCESVVNWLNANSPYKPGWAKTHVTIAVSNIAFTLSGTAPDFNATMSGTVAVSKRVDMPMWQPRSAGMQQAWRNMWTQLRAHEAEHERIADEWKATFQDRVKAWTADVSGRNRQAAEGQAFQRFQADQETWQQEHQDAQNAIDPYAAPLMCPDEPATVAPSRIQRSTIPRARARRTRNGGRP